MPSNVAIISLGSPGKSSGPYHRRERWFPARYRRDEGLWSGARDSVRIVPADL